MAAATGWACATVNGVRLTLDHDDLGLSACPARNVHGPHAPWTSHTPRAASIHSTMNGHGGPSSNGVSVDGGDAAHGQLYAAHNGPSSSAGHPVNGFAQ